jgi:predicted nucleotidyltransferase
MDEQVKRILAELRQELERLYGDRLRHLILFGSQARGDAEPGWDSDIDVLVVLRGPVVSGEEIERSSRIVADLSLRHDVAVSRIFMDEDRFRYRSGPLLRNVRRDGIPV